jgi:hypothetical protein
MRMMNYYDEYPRLLNNYPDDDDQNLIKAKRRNNFSIKNKIFTKFGCF